MIDIDDYARRAVASPIAQPPRMATVTSLAKRLRRRRRLFRTTVTLALVGVIGVGALAAVSARHRRSLVEVHSPTPILGRFDPVPDQTDIHGPRPKPIPIRLNLSIRQLGGWVRDASGKYVEEAELGPKRLFEWRKDSLGNWELNEQAGSSKTDGLVRETSVDGVARRWRDGVLESEVDRDRKYGDNSGPGAPVPELGPYGATLVLSMSMKENENARTVESAACFDRPCTHVTFTGPVAAGEGDYLPLVLGSENTLTEDVTYDDATKQVLVHRVSLNGKVISEFEVTSFETLPGDFVLAPGALRAP